MPHRVEPGDGPERRAADERAHEIDGRLGWIVAGIAVDVQLVAGERSRVARDGQLHRPTFGVAVPQARARSREAEVVGVVVDGLEAEGLGRVGIADGVGGCSGQGPERTARART